MPPKPGGDEPPKTEWIPIRSVGDRQAAPPAPPAAPPTPRAAPPTPPAPKPAAAPPTPAPAPPPRRPRPDHAPVGAAAGRWDAVLVEASGPEAGRSHAVRGPLVRIGRAPGPGGLALEGSALLEPAHAVLDLTDGHAIVSAVGSAHVRVAERGEELREGAPIRGAVRVAPGALLHLGPLTRGVTLRLADVHPVASWRERTLRAVAVTTGLHRVTTGLHRKDGHAAEGLVPPEHVWAVRAALAFTGLLATGIAAVAFAVYQRPIEPLGPTDEGVERYRWVPGDAPIDRAVFEGFDGAFAAFVMAPNAAAADWPALAEDRALWDEELVRRVGISATAHAKLWPFWRRLEAVRSDYATVLGVLREAGLPEVFAAIPFYESGYQPGARGMDCELGYWQFLPEVALRGGLVVRDCTLRGATRPWTPTRLVPVIAVHENAVYMEGGRCRITSCEQDERADLTRSARAAAAMLGEAWRDPTLAASGAAVQLTISSHNAGYDNSRFEEGRRNPINILPAYQRWVAAKGVARAPDFVGANILCAEPGPGKCGGAMWGYTQHYAYNVIAQHLLAVCYYAVNHADDQPAFAAWRRWEDGYCRAFRVPDKGSIPAG